MKAFLLATSLLVATFAIAPAHADGVAATPAQVAQLRALGKALPISALDQADAAAAIRQAQADGGLDLGTMPVEDAVMLMFMLISQDAEADTRAQLEEMDATRKDKQALRENAARMADEARKQRGEMQQAYAAKHPGMVIRQTVVIPPKPLRANVAMRPMVAAPAAMATMVDQRDDKLDSKNEVSDVASMRLQMAMDRLSKMMSTLSNILKKQSDTENSIINNIK